MKGTSYDLAVCGALHADCSLNINIIQLMIPGALRAVAFRLGRLGRPSKVFFEGIEIINLNGHLLLGVVLLLVFCCVVGLNCQPVSRAKSAEALYEMSGASSRAGV